MTTALDRLQPYRLALEASPTAVLVADAAGSIVFVNTRLEKLFGYDDKDELVGQSVDVLGRDVAGRSRGAGAGEAQAADGPPTPAGGALTGRRRDGSFVDFEMELAPIGTGSG